MSSCAVRLWARGAPDFRLPLFAMAGCFGLCVLVGGTLIRMAERRGLDARADRAELPEPTEAAR